MQQDSINMNALYSACKLIVIISIVIYIIERAQEKCKYNYGYPDVPLCMCLLYLYVVDLIITISFMHDVTNSRILYSLVASINNPIIDI